jgi:hypothetical protein
VVVDDGELVYDGAEDDRICDESPPEGGRLFGNAGDDYIWLGDSEGDATGGPGADTFVCDDPNPGQIVIDYNPDEGDTIEGQCNTADRALQQQQTEPAPVGNATTPPPPPSNNVTEPQQPPSPPPPPAAQEPPREDDDNDEDDEMSGNSTSSE